MLWQSKGWVLSFVLYSTIETELRHTNKLRTRLFLLLKMLLFSGVLVLLWYQLNGVKKEAWEQFGISKSWALFGAILLVIPNIYLAYRKWLVTLKTIEISADRKTKVHSFFAGLVTGLLTPNMIGNFIGRFYYFEKEHRANIAAFTVLSNIGQFLASITFGAVSVIWLGELLVWKDEERLMYVLLIIVVVSYLFFFYIDNFLRFFKKMKFGASFKQLLKKSPWFRTQILFLSFGRFLIFTLQFSLMLMAFGADWTLELIAAIWQVYLLTMIAPSLILGKVGVKESIALFVLASLSVNEVAILFASLSIWILNTVSPALLGLLICRDKSWRQQA
ncbi:MAG: flippase-like domain-containing protein [bacterium]|nr:flippase-like domain-containing protein [bacterium]